MQRICQVCDYEFRDGDRLVAIMLSKFVAIESGVSYAIEEPRKCLELIHQECYGGPIDDSGEPREYGGVES